jgi:hypothetical protein
MDAESMLSVFDASIAEASSEKSKQLTKLQRSGAIASNRRLA